MAKRIRLNALPKEVRDLPPAVRDELLREEGIEIDTVAEELSGNPFGSGMQPEQIASAKVAGDVLSRIPRAAAGTASAAAGGVPLPAAMASGFVNSLAGPDPTSGHGIANMISDVAFGRLAPIIQGAKALASPARAALAGGAMGTANVAATQALGNKLAEAKGEQTESVNPFIGGLLGAAAGVAPALSGYMGKALDKAKGKAAALGLLQGGRLSPTELTDAQRRLTQAMQAQGLVEEMNPTQRLAAGMYDGGQANPFKPPPGVPKAAPAPAPKPAPQIAPAGPVTSDGIPLKPRNTTPYDDMLMEIVNDPDGAIKGMEMTLDLRKRGVPAPQVAEIEKRFRELMESKTTASRAAATQASGLDFRRVDEGRPSRAAVDPVTSDGLPLRPRTAPAAVPPDSPLGSPLATPAETTLGELANTRMGSAFAGLDEEIRKVSPKALAGLDGTVKQTLGEMRSKATDDGGISSVISKALKDPTEFSNLPRYIDALDTAFPTLNARKTVQAQITESVLSGFGDDTQANLKMLQRIRGMGEDRAKVINKVFGSQDAYRNVELLHDIMEESQSGMGGKLKMFFNGTNQLLGVPIGAATFYVSSSALGGTAAPAVLGGAAVLGGGKLITLTVDKLADYVAQNRGKSLDVIYDLVRGGSKYTPQTVNQVLGGLRRRAVEERDATPQDLERLEFLRSEGLR